MGAAQALGVPATCIAKSVALLAGAQPWLAVIRGGARLDLHKVWGWSSLPLILGQAATAECLYLYTHCNNLGKCFQVAEVIGINRRKIKIASAEDCIATFGHAPGK